MSNWRRLCGLGVVVCGMSLTAATLGQNNSAPAAPPAGGAPRVEMEVAQGGKPMGKIVIELDLEKAPITARNFLQYVEDKFYDGTIFHRVMPDFMIQGGGFTSVTQPKQDGLRGPIFNEAKNGLKNARGTIAMARTGQPHSATAQFFINVADNTSKLDDPGPGDRWGYCVFGKVVDGMDVVDAIKNVKTQVNPQMRENSQPVDPPVLTSAKVVGAYDREKLNTAAKAAEDGIKTKAAESRKQADAAAAEAKKKADELIANQDKLLQETIKKIEAETKSKLTKTDSGLMYVVLKEGGGPSPKPTDTVEVHYTGWLLDGTKVDSSVDRGQPMVRPLNKVVRGWTEGVGMMKVGEKRKLIIPPDLGYGANPRPGGPVPPNAYLVFDIELLSIK